MKIKKGKEEYKTKSVNKKAKYCEEKLCGRKKNHILTKLTKSCSQKRIYQVVFVKSHESYDTIN